MFHGENLLVLGSHLELRIQVAGNNPRFVAGVLRSLAGGGGRFASLWKGG